MNLVWTEGNDVEAGILKQEVIDFAKRLISAWQEPQEPVLQVDVYEQEHGGLAVLAFNNKLGLGLHKLYLAPPQAVQEGLPKERDTLAAQNEALRSALEVIAGKRQCCDNTLSNLEVARYALNLPNLAAEVLKEHNHTQLELDL